MTFFLTTRDAARTAGVSLRHFHRVAAQLGCAPVRLGSETSEYYHHRTQRGRVMRWRAEDVMKVRDYWLAHKRATVPVSVPVL